MQQLAGYINSYKENFGWISQKEIYKWKAIKWFKYHWDINALEFAPMLESSIDLAGNLLKSKDYYPLRMIVNYAYFDPEGVRTLFKELFNEDLDIFERILRFQEGTEAINALTYPDRITYQDPRAIIVYLTLNYPERYFFYKFGMFKTFSEKMALAYKPIRGRLENIAQFNRICEQIRHVLTGDQELLQLHKGRISENCYFDHGLNVLTQDFIYAVSIHLDTIPAHDNPIAHPETKIDHSPSAGLKSRVPKLDFRGRFVNFLANSIENKRVGELGEDWVITHEKNKLQQAGLFSRAEEIEHTSRKMGDGTGYDIRSFDLYGNPIYIEVKTTKGKKLDTFYITRPELEFSRSKPNQFYLYRVYNLDELQQSADLFIIHGDLSDICALPSVYMVNLLEG